MQIMSVNAWRPVPGFAPAAATFAASVAQLDWLRAGFAEAARAGLQHPGAASGQAQRLFTVLSGVISKQMANQPGAGYGTGMFTSLTGAALDMSPARYIPPGGTNADPRP